jgi:hypothetical protein
MTPGRRRRRPALLDGDKRRCPWCGREDPPLRRAYGLPAHQHQWWCGLALWPDLDTETVAGQLDVIAAWERLNADRPGADERVTSMLRELVARCDALHVALPVPDDLAELGTGWQRW